MTFLSKLRQSIAVALVDKNVRAPILLPFANRNHMTLGPEENGSV